MPTRLIPWTVEIKELATQLRVGAHAHESRLVPVSVDIVVRAITPAVPRTIEDCMNYQPICQWMLIDWPALPHAPSLETRLRELMRFVFDFDERIEWVDITLQRPGATAASHGLSVRRAESRQDFALHAGDPRRSTTSALYAAM